MKHIEIVGGLRLPLNNEEASIVEKVKNKEIKKVFDLNERDREVLLNLTKKNVLNIDKNDLIHFNGLQPAEEAVW
jgi:hypothetical protein